jgi:hypothetical protein
VAGFGSDPFGTSAFGAPATAPFSSEGTASASVTTTGAASTILTQWDQSVVSSSTEAIKVEIWDGNTLVAIVRPKTGSVTADFATGVRYSLSATFDPSLASLLVPGVEVRPYRGFNYGYGAPEYEPLGRFPLTGTSLGIKPDADISVSCSDRWQYVTKSTFLNSYTATPGRRIREILTDLIVGTGMWTASDIANTITSTAVATTQVWDQDRGQAIADLCQAVGAEAYVARDGSVVLRNRRALSAPVVTIRSGRGQRLIDGSVTLDTADVYNVVVIVPANPDPAFTLQPVIVRITDPKHPAYPIPGKRITRPYRLDQGQATAQAQLAAMAQKVLTKISAPARTVTLSTLVDCRLKESDTFALVWPDGTSENLQIQQITYPLTVGEAQQITGVATRSDEDFNP